MIFLIWLNNIIRRINILPFYVFCLFTIIFSIDFVNVYSQTKKILSDSSRNNPIENFIINQNDNILEEDNFGIANGRITLGVRFKDLINIRGLWAPPFVSSDFSIEGKINGLSIGSPDYIWYPYYINRKSSINPNFLLGSNTILIPDERAGLVNLTIENKSSEEQLLPIVFSVKGNTLDNITQYSLDTQYWGFGHQLSEITTIKKSLSSDLIIDKLFNSAEFNVFDTIFAFNNNDFFWQNSLGIYGDKIPKTIINTDSILLQSDFLKNDQFVALCYDTIYWQSSTQVRRGFISNCKLYIDTSFLINKLSINDRMFAISDDTIYWQSGNQVSRGIVSKSILKRDSSFTFTSISINDSFFGVLGNKFFWQNETSISQGEVYRKLTNNIYEYYLKDISLIYNGFAREDRVMFIRNNNIYWRSSQQLKRGNIRCRSTIKLEQGINSVIISTSKNLTWDAIKNVFSGSLLVPPKGKVNLYIAFSIGKTNEALKTCNRIISNPELVLLKSKEVYSRRINELFHKLPQFESNNISLVKFYNRSLVPFLINRWEIPEFKLNPYYSTGSINGGCIGNYLWNFGESMEIISLYDPKATKAHIRQFLTTGVEKGFGFRPLYGEMLEHNYFYPVNQEKIIGLTYNYIKNTGDVAFLKEKFKEGTILDAIISQALFFDDTIKPVSLIDYNICDPINAGGLNHLELRSDIYNYRYIMPDLNGRRYLNYHYAAGLSQLTGIQRNYLYIRADSLKMILRKELWDSKNNWFKFQDTRANIKDIRYTVQMFYLIGSDVLDIDQSQGLLNHLNESEFLSDFGLHSLSKKEIGLAYDLNDIDNGGPGCCTSFPLNIAKKLYLSGNYQIAEEILKRILWWGEKVPYWGDSFYADRPYYRRNTPLQCTIDGVSGAQCIIFGMFGIAPQFDDTIVINPRPPSFATHISLKGVKLRNRSFDVIVNEDVYEVIFNEKRHIAKVGQTSIIRNNTISVESN